MPINLEQEPPILGSHIPLMGKECEFQFFDLDLTFDLKSTLGPKLYLSHIPESVLISVPFILDPKLSILSNHIPLLDQGIDHNDSEMIFQVWSYNRMIFILVSCMILISSNVNRKEVIKSRFHETSHYLDWVATLSLIQ